MTAADSVLTLSDLERWSFAGTALAVLGHPISHSISPAMHNAALAERSASDERLRSWRYFRFDVAPASLPAALEALHARGFEGLNLTVPHKVLAFDQVAEIDEAARPIGAVNTLRRGPRGWRAFNTDGYGLIAALREDLAVALGGSAVVILGAGGAARGAAVACLQAGCASLHLANRTPARLEALLPALVPLAKATGARLGAFAPDRPPPDLSPGAVVINATSAGLRESDPAPVDLRTLPGIAAVYDMIYNPPRTRLLDQASALGLRAAGGLSMLVHQGAKAFEIWTGSSAASVAPTMRRAAAAALASG